DGIRDRTVTGVQTCALPIFKAQFVQELFDAPFPFVDSPRPEMSKEEFTRGAQFFYSLQCLKCHVLGDPNVAGANKSPTAPNLSRSEERRVGKERVSRITARG